MDRGEGVAVGLLERASELGVLSDSLECARRGAGRLVVVEGPAGIGKTRLLDACGEGAVARGMVALRARGDEVAMESSFGAVRELLWARMQACGPDVLDGAAGLAAPVFGGGGGEVPVDRDRSAGVLHGLYWLVANLADQAPVVLLVDDAHWLDAASARFLVYLGRRVGSLAVLLAVGARRGEAAGLAGRLSGLSELGAGVLRPGPLSEAASGVLVRRELGAGADRELCRSCHQATGGNPLYLLELTAALRAEGRRPTAELARRVRALGADAIRASVLVRVARLGGDCERLAQAVAVLGQGSQLRQAAMLADLGREAAEAAADGLRAADVLVSGRALSFAHPVVGEAVAAELPSSRRAGLHARAAALLAVDGAAADRVAAHLLSAEPYGERWVVDALRAAASQALAHGAPEAAVSYLRRALAEPPSPDVRLEVLLELGRAETLLPIAQDFAPLREALALAGDPRRRAEIALELAWGLTGATRNADVALLLEGVLERGEGLDPVLVERIEALLIGGGTADLTATGRVLARAAGHFERARRGEVGDPVMLAALALVGSVAGVPAGEAAGLARLALEDESLLEHGVAHMGATAALCWADRLSEAARAQDTAIAEAQRRGSAPMFTAMSLWRGETAMRAGELDVAEDHLRRAHELAGELGAGHFAVMLLIGLLLERGRVGEALELVGSVELEERQLVLWQGVIVLAQRGRVRVARGELERGVADLLDADRRMSGSGLQLSVLVDWASTAALALFQLGHAEQARELAGRELSAAVAFGAPRRHGIALSVCGLLEDGGRGLTCLREAVRVLERSPARLEHARALANLGRVLNACGQREQAREALSRALDIAHRCGGHALAEQTRVALIASGARPRRDALSGPGALTPAELRAARMAAGGLSNREIAQGLFVSAKTVEGQLSHAYTKLQIHTRAQLATALSAADRRPSVERPPGGVKT